LVQQAGFGHFHATGVGRAMVLMTVQVQRTMHDQMRQMMRDASARRGRLSSYDAKRQHYFRRGVLVGQHIGGFVATPMPRIQFAHQTIVGEHHIQSAMGHRTRHARTP
jgi:hypothetical protein